MKLVIIPDVDGDSFSIINERFPPENYIPVEDKKVLSDAYDLNDILTMLISFNKSAVVAK